MYKRRRNPLYNVPLFNIYKLFYVLFFAPFIYLAKFLNRNNRIPIDNDTLGALLFALFPIALGVIVGGYQRLTYTPILFESISANTIPINFRSNICNSTLSSWDYNHRMVSDNNVIILYPASPYLKVPVAYCNFSGKYMTVGSVSGTEIKKCNVIDDKYIHKTRPNVFESWYLLNYEEWEKCANNYYYEKRDIIRTKGEMIEIYRSVDFDGVYMLSDKEYIYYFYNDVIFKKVYIGKGNPYHQFFNSDKVGIKILPRDRFDGTPKIINNV